MGTMKVTGSAMEDFGKSASAQFDEALEAAVDQEPERTGSGQRTYVVERSWFQGGGVVGKRIYYVELAISGVDIPDT